MQKERQTEPDRDKQIVNRDRQEDKIERDNHTKTGGKGQTPTDRQIKERDRQRQIKKDRYMVIHTHQPFIYDVQQKMLKLKNV